MKHLLLTTRRNIFFVGLLLAAEAVCFAQTASLQTQLNAYFTTYDLGFTLKGEQCRVEKVAANVADKTLDIVASEAFGMQSFDRRKVERIYHDLTQMLPQAYKGYTLRVYVGRYTIDDLVVGGSHGGDEALPRRMKSARQHGHQWVANLSRAYKAGRGLDGHHLSLWASHGNYYSQSDGRWQWQRPRLFCTTEDLFSQTFVVPLLMPMLENAGAVLYSPRERDWQKNEAIVDNDRPEQSGTYTELNGEHAWQDGPAGFAHLKDVYADGDNPFADGTARIVAAQQRRSQATTAVWTPQIPADGRYAVYVSYATLPNSVPDATYVVRHRGQQTRFSVNQRMGGGTWVYLGTFDFAAGCDRDNCVILSNQSDYRGYVSADAVRFGGGMGNIARGSAGIEPAVSGLPRFLEGARYAVQWGGAPYSVYADKNGTNDYAEDINSRSHMVNYLAGGSEFLPRDSGLRVPIEMNIALHTDAGYTRDLSTIGTLGIYTTNFNEGFYATGLSRLVSRDLCDMVLSQVDADLQHYAPGWTRRQMYDRNYSETREPAVPSMILEMLSHQNFADLCLAHDPYFKFILARAVYKGVLRSVYRMQGLKNPIVQPLPPAAPMAVVSTGGRDIELTWQPVDDPLEESAKAEYFVVYHAEADGDFDNGTSVDDSHFVLQNATPGVLHRFYITACNDGGQSMPTEEVCAFVGREGSRRVLVVDAFNRVAGPQPFDNDSLQGFDMATDFGVPMARMPGYCGRQLCFNKSGYGREGYGALGHSTAELEGIIVAGNTRDWCTRHARDIVAATDGRVSVSSCTAAAAARLSFDSRSFELMDIAFGLNKADGYSLLPAKVFAPELLQVVAEFTRAGGSILVSGAYIGNDMQRDDERVFTRSVLKYEYAGSLPTDSLGQIAGLSQDFSIFNVPNEQSYAVSSVDCLAPMSGAFCAMVYSESRQSAAVAYQGSDYRSFAMGLPLEAVAEADVRVELMRGIIQFLLP